MATFRPAGEFRLNRYPGSTSTASRSIRLTRNSWFQRATETGHDVLLSGNILSATSLCPGQNEPQKAQGGSQEGHKLLVLFGLFLCLLCTFPDLLEKAEPVRSACSSNRGCNRKDFSRCLNIDRGSFRTLCMGYNRLMRLQERS